MGKEEYESNEVELIQKEELREEYEKKTLAATKDVHKRQLELESRPEPEGSNKKQHPAKKSRKKHIHPKQQSPELQMEQTAAESSMSKLSDASQVQEQEQQQSKVETEEANQQLDEQHVQPDLVSASGDTNGENEKEKSLEINETLPLQEQQQQQLKVETEKVNQQLDEQVQSDLVSAFGDANGVNEKENSLEINDTQPLQEQQQQQLEVETEKTNQQLDEQQVQSDLISVSGDTNEENEKEKLLGINETQSLQEQPQNERQNYIQKSENIPTSQQKSDGRRSGPSGIKREIDEQNDTQKPQVKRKT
ncbi:hypothetical protein BDC45DRAFT_143196 [Circinella umbellata]|nr:hypothetical protein BDC45DRAFT_143196 [Circinella umbellata]